MGDAPGVRCAEEGQLRDVPLVQNGALSGAGQGCGGGLDILVLPDKCQLSLWMG